MKRTIVFVAFGMVTLSPGAVAQGPIGSLLKIDVNAWTLYESTSVDPSQLGRNLQPGPVPGNTNPLPMKAYSELATSCRSTVRLRKVRYF